MHSSSRRLAVEVITALLIVAAIGSLLLLNRSYQSTIDKKDAEIATLKNAAEEPGTSEPVNDAPTPSEDTVAIVFTPEGLFDEAEKQEITTKLIEPFIDYRKEQSETSNLASIHIQHPTEGDEGVEYLVDVISQDESYQGFIYGDSTSETQPWYQPQCFEECTFSDTYKQKYPEVVKQEDDKE